MKKEDGLAYVLALLLVSVAIYAAVLCGFAYTVAGAYESLSEGRRSDALVWLVLVGVFCTALFGSAGKGSS